MNSLIAIFIGGGLGSLARYGIGNWMAGISQSAFPYGTLLANVISSLILGIFLGLSTIKSGFNETSRFFITIGFCGGFSTFSTFSAETFELIKNGYFLNGMINITANLLACLLMIVIGIWIGKST